MATKRILRKPAEIRELIENSGLKYVMINNRILDDFLKQGEGSYTPYRIIDSKTKKEKYLDHEYNEYEFSNMDEEIKATFDERDLIIFIFLKFLEKQEFNGYTKEIADYLGYSDKRLKQRLKKLEFLQGNVNNTYNHKANERTIYKEYKKVRLISNKSITGYENGKKRVFNRWYVNFDCDYKQEVNKETGELMDIPENFFIVTIYDLDLYTKGILNEKEFITYLYLIKSYDSKKNQAIYQSISAISNNINIKNSNITERILTRLESVRVKDVFCKDDEDLPLIHVSKPANFSKKLLTREEPSYKYDPIYNRTTIQKIEGAKVTTGYEDDLELFMDGDSTNTDTNLYIDTDFSNMDSDISF